MIPATGIIDRYAFNQRELDGESALHHYRARAYDSAVGRFLEVEPILSDRVKEHYRYATNNPVLYRDPSGNQAEPRIRKSKDPSVRRLYAVLKGQTPGTLPYYHTMSYLLTRHYFNGLRNTAGLGKRSIGFGAMSLNSVEANILLHIKDIKEYKSVIGLNASIGGDARYIHDTLFGTSKRLEFEGSKTPFQITPVIWVHELYHVAYRNENARFWGETTDEHMRAIVQETGLVRAVQAMNVMQDHFDKGNIKAAKAAWDGMGGVTGELKRIRDSRAYTTTRLRADILKGYKVNLERVADETHVKTIFLARDPKWADVFK